MKGYLHKIEDAWEVRYDVFQNDYSYPLPAYNFIRLSLEDAEVQKMMGWQGKEIHFDIIYRLVYDELTKSSIKIPHYAKIIKGDGMSEKPNNHIDENGKSITYWGGLDFTNPNVNNITSNSTQISHTNKQTAVEFLFAHLLPFLDWSKTENRIKFRQLEQEALNMESYQIEILDADIDKAAKHSMEEIYHSPNDKLSFYIGWNRAIKWYREQLKLRQ